MALVNLKRDTELSWWIPNWPVWLVNFN